MSSPLPTCRKRSLKRTTSGRSAVTDDEDGQGVDPDEAAEDEDDTGDLITDDMVFLNDLSAPPMVHRPSSSNSTVQPNGQPNAEAGPSRSRSRSFTKSASRSVSPKKRSVSPLKPVGESEQAGPAGKKKFVRVDPYELPELANKSMHPAGGKTDERLATEEELRDFIDEMKASDLDVSSAEFLALPPEVQYEITNDLRLRSRAPNYRRTALMVQSSATALDFSKAQIAGLKVRNNLTQRMWGLAGVEGGLVAEGGRIAGEKGREYCLIKNEKEGGWSLGIRNEGTSEKPIDIAEEDEDEDRIGGEGRPRKRRRMIRGGVLIEELSGDDSEGEFHRPEPCVAVHRPQLSGLIADATILTLSGRPKPVDPDWLEQKRKSALDALAARYSPVKKPTKVVRQPQVFAAPRAADAPPLFEIESSSAEGSEDGRAAAEARLAEDEDADFQRALELSASDAARVMEVDTQPPMSSDPIGDAELEAAIALSRRAPSVSDDDDEDDMEEVTPVTTSIVRPVTAPVPIELASSSVDGDSGDEMEEIHLPTPPQPRPAIALSARPGPPPVASSNPSEVIALESDDNDGDELVAGPVMTTSRPRGMSVNRPVPRLPTPLSVSESTVAPVVTPFAPSSQPAPHSGEPQAAMVYQPASRPMTASASVANGPTSRSSSRPDAEVLPSAVDRSSSASVDILAVSQPPAPRATAPPPVVDLVVSSPDASVPASPLQVADTELEPSPVPFAEEPDLPPVSGAQLTQEARTLQRQSSPPAPPVPLTHDESEMEWSPSPPPMQAYRAEDDQQPPTDAEADEQTADEGAVDESADQDDYARFLAQVKGKDLQQVQDDLSAELKTLNQQRKKQTGEGDENITQQMVAQVQVRSPIDAGRLYLQNDGPSADAHFAPTAPPDRLRCCCRASAFLTSPLRWRPRPSAPSSPTCGSSTASSPTTRTFSFLAAPNATRTSSTTRSTSSAISRPTSCASSPSRATGSSRWPSFSAPTMRPASPASATSPRWRSWPSSRARAMRVSSTSGRGGSRSRADATPRPTPTRAGRKPLCVPASTLADACLQLTRSRCARSCQKKKNKANLHLDASFPNPKVVRFSFIEPPRRCGSSD